MRASVDFPQPDSPTTPSTSPARSSRSTPATAWTFRPPAREPARNSLTSRSARRTVRPAVSGDAVMEDLLGAVARRQDSGRRRPQERTLGPAEVDGVGAARVEGAPRWRLGG